MGGFGSGRPAGRGKVEACRSIDANWLHREGCLRAGSMASCQWSHDGDKVTPTNMRAEHDRLHLTKLSNCSTRAATTPTRPRRRRCARTRNNGGPTR
jgi:hypothetical protein